MPNLEAREAEAFAEKVRHTFEGYRFGVNDESVQVTVSIGVALFPEHGDTYQRVLEAANLAEAEAKRSRNAVRVSR